MNGGDCELRPADFFCRVDRCTVTAVDSARSVDDPP